MLLGKRAQVAVERALSEFRSGRPVLITSASDAITALPVDGMTQEMLVAFRLLSRPVRPFLLVTARRARAIGVDTSDPTGIALPDFCNAGEIFSLAADRTVDEAGAHFRSYVDQQVHLLSPEQSIAVQTARSRFISVRASSSRAASTTGFTSRRHTQHALLGSFGRHRPLATQSHGIGGRSAMLGTPTGPQRDGCAR